LIAVGLMKYGEPDVLQVITVPEPVPGPGEVIVEVVAATVNPSDTLLRAGAQAAQMKELSPPYIPGMEFAGYVHDVGADVTKLLPGQPVMGLVSARRPGGGAHAQYVRALAASVVSLPRSTDLTEAATVPMNGLTAKMCLEALDLSPGDTVLVTGGAGAVGGYVTQLAKHAGLTVIADATESDATLLRELGADHVVPRGDRMAPAVLQHRPRGADGAVDAAALGPQTAAAVRDGGVLVLLRRAQEVQDPRVRRRYVSVLDELANNSALAWLRDRYADGTLTARVAVSLPPARAAEAHRLLEGGGLRGRAVLVFRERQRGPW
jgi:NADPH:quinone reductase